MDHAVGYIARRGLAAHSAFSANGGDDTTEPILQVPAWFWILFSITTILFIAFSSMISYTYGDLIATLCMVESPAAVLEPMPNEGADSTEKGTSQVDPDLILVKQFPITSSLRKTILYLREKAGRRSLFRGISIYLVHQFALAQMTSFFRFFDFIPQEIAFILATVTLANLHLAWTHIIITEPSEKYWFKRLPSIKLWKKVAIPTAIAAICQNVSITLPMALFSFFAFPRLDLQSGRKMDNASLLLVATKFFVVILLGILCIVAIVIPSTVSLIRVQASLISDEDETIVPFDRSFGGRVIPAIVGGSGVVSMLDAWKSFDWNSCARLLKIYFKVMAMQIGVILSYAIVVAFQFHLVVGREGAWKFAVAT